MTSQSQTTDNVILDQLIRSVEGLGESEATLLAEHLEDLRSDDEWDLDLVEASLGNIVEHAMMLKHRLEAARKRQPKGTT